MGHKSVKKRLVFSSKGVITRFLGRYVSGDFYPIDSEFYGENFELSPARKFQIVFEIGCFKVDPCLKIFGLRQKNQKNPTFLDTNGFDPVLGPKPRQILVCISLRSLFRWRKRARGKKYGYQLQNGQFQVKFGFFWPIFGRF